MHRGSSPIKPPLHRVEKPESTDACVFPSALVAEGVDGVLYRGPVSPERARFQRKPPHLDFAREYEASRSYHAARATLDALTKRHRQHQIAQEERFDRDVNAAKFTAQFAETRLGTCGVPTLNTMSVIIDRQRRAADAAASSPQKQQQQRNQSDQSGRARSERIRDAVRRAYGSQTLDLKALELVHIPEQVYTTLLLQLARLIRCVNVSRNALRDIPSAFCAAFPEAEALVYKENALANLPANIAALAYLQTLDVACNELAALPQRLPPSLHVLDASRNRLTHIPNLHTLTKLVELDLSHNHFQVPPHGLMFATKLRLLRLVGNRLVTLALPPKSVEDAVDDRDAGGDAAKHAKQQRDEDAQVAAALAGLDRDGNALDPEVAKKDWRVQVDPETQATVYYHIATKSVTRAKPACFQVQIPKLQLARGASTTTAATATLTQQAALSNALAYPGGWEIRVADGTSTDVTFVNHGASPAQAFVNSIPPELDRLGDLTYLQSLVISGNQLLDLPPSIGKLVRLKRLEAEHNKLLALPDTLHDLQALEVVKLGMNALAWLPESFTKLARLTDLDLKLNRFERLPASFGELRGLQTLDLSANALVALPASFLSLTKLASLKLQNNSGLTRKADSTSGTGSFTPETLATGDIQQVFWQLRHQLECERRGALPPVPQSKIVGVGDEVWSTDIHLHKEFAQAIAVAASPPFVLDFHWKHLTLAQFPRTFFSTLSSLRELRLSGHDLDVIPSEFRSLRALRVLHLRKNKIRALADDVFGPAGDTSGDRGRPTDAQAMSELVDLDLEYNALESLPPSIQHLRKLTVLRVSNNRLSWIPESIGRLDTALRELHLAHNRFEEPPSGLSALLRLETLDLSYNQLKTLETMDFLRLSRLQSLRVNVNQLTALPASLGATQLQELWIAGNYFVEFPDPILALKGSLTSLRMQSNKIYRLPVTFGELARLDDVQSDGNPFKSPPPEVMNLGIELIRAYLLKRQQRIAEISALLEANRFAYDPSCFSELKVQRLLVRPRNSGESTTSASNGSEDGAAERLRFLTPTHIAAFERAVDTYVNGTFYLLDTRGADLVNDLLLKTQFALAQRHRAQVLDDLLRLCALIKRKQWADKVDFRYDCDRPWGRHGEDVGVFHLDPSILYDDQVAPEPDARGVRATLPSILRVIQTRVRHGFEAEAFAHSRDAVCDAIEHYVGLYGPIGIAHDSVPFKCGCEDLLRFHKMHEPCYRPGWTFLQVIYTQEEADRRVRDETAIADAMRALRPQIETFLKTSEGEKRFHKEVKAIKDALRRELQELKRKLTRARKKHKARARALERAQQAEAKLLKRDPLAAAEAAAQRSVADVKAREDEIEEVQKLRERVTQWTKEYDDGRARLGAGYATFFDAVVSKLLESVGAQVRHHLIQQQREQAIAQGWRRPWDGRNGRDFEQYKLLVRRQMLADGTMESEASAPPVAGETEDQETKDASDNSEISDVSFEGYDDLVLDTGALAHGRSGEDDEDDESEDDAEPPLDTAAALANLVVSDVSDDDDDDANGNGRREDSDDSEI